MPICLWHRRGAWALRLIWVLASNKPAHARGQGLSGEKVSRSSAYLIWSPLLINPLCLIVSFPRTNWTALVVEDHWEQRPRGLWLAWFIAPTVNQPLVARWPWLGSLNPVNRAKGTSHAQRSPCYGDLSTWCWCHVFAYKVGVWLVRKWSRSSSTFIRIVALKGRLNLMNWSRSLVGCPQSLVEMHACIRGTKKCLVWRFDCSYC